VDQKTWNANKMEFYSAIKKNEIMPFSPSCHQKEASLTKTKIIWSYLSYMGENIKAKREP
jgi:hypothetical protein